MKLFVPEPAITLYEHGFDDHDLLDRKAQGQQLSNLVENISDPMVIALDGEWGSGKTVFLKCWVGEHLKTKTHQAQTIYFDAFEHDFMNDPLIALIGAIDARLPKDDENKHLEKLKKVAPWLARTGFRGALAYATAGATEIAGPMVDAAINTISGAADKQNDQFWQQERQKQQSLQDFNDALTELAQDQKLIIVIDELDRCRPDFALSMLEILKHLFHVPNVHFVLGVNLTALEHSVHARYGAGIDAGRYLKKFYNLTQNLNESSFSNLSHLRYEVLSLPKTKIESYFRNAFISLGYEIKEFPLDPESLMWTTMHTILARTGLIQKLSYRDINTICTHTSLLLQAKSSFGVYLKLLAAFNILRTVDPRLFRSAMKFEANSEKILETLGLNNLEASEASEDDELSFFVLSIVGFFHDDPLSVLDSNEIERFEQAFFKLKGPSAKRMKELAIFENIEVPLRTINVTCLQ